MKSLSLHRLLACVRRPWLRAMFDLPTHLTDREKIALFDLARERSQSVQHGVNVVEIGSYLGASSSFLAAGLGKDTDRVFCIDTWSNDAMSEGTRDTMDAFRANTARYRDRIVPIRGWSHDPAVIAQIASRAGSIDLLFIDGDHSLQGVLDDWNLYSPMLSPGAVVAMHDIGWAEGVQRVVADHARARVARETRLPNLWWGQLPP